MQLGVPACRTLLAVAVAVSSFRHCLSSFFFPYWNTQVRPANDLGYTISHGTLPRHPTIFFVSVLCSSFFYRSPLSQPDVSKELLRRPLSVYTPAWLLFRSLVLLFFFPPTLICSFPSGFNNLFSFFWLVVQPPPNQARTYFYPTFFSVAFSSFERSSSTARRHNPRSSRRAF